ncbi:DNA polymerase epsilon subunit 1 [Sporothrix schenckii 1099-18]|uniref:DNA polymerase epsilon catalytic subunit n=1 Tax=Sporothrix schenckii 1099-18 TaxID=1397361 RepID=A0A0F2M1D5_SPOSC|nr:DNA polymerase epsilon subunit 1 [Sporothrix schenckii 1099-18]KJR83517.1 DNA polymerase epsilon subunit 1 [Sporothrix schenckii 1099-18]
MPNTTLRRQPQKGFRKGGAKKAYHGGSGTRPQRTFAAGSGRNEGTSADEKWERTRLAHAIDEKMGFPRYEGGRKREGWLVNIEPTSIEDDRVEGGGGRAAVDLYFIDLHPDGNAAAGPDADATTFKATIEYEPYFLVAVRKGHETEVEEWCKRVPGGGGLVKRVRRVDKEDLQMPNHLLGYRRTFLELRFDNVQNLMAVRRDIMPIAEANKKGMNAMDTYAEVAGSTSMLGGGGGDSGGGDGDSYDYGHDLYDDDSRNAHADDQARRTNTSVAEASDYIVDIREYDVPYHVRVLIDMDIRVGKWYTVDVRHGVTTVACNADRLAMADPVVMAFDIETTKSPLKFPDATIDQVMMISYMIDGQGFLITNRDIVSEDIADFEYTPRPEYPGPFMIFNEPDEKALLERFFLHVKEARPTVIATYNGDFFDWPFVEARASANGIDMYHEIGWRRDSEEQYKCDYSVHMDCFHWVNRDSYLPQGSRGLKAVTVAKLGYDPDELDPELMLPYAQERPQTLAEYSVSDAVATYYLYMKYVHPFIFSLCTILPLSPDEVLRKGTGTLCEMLLMVQAYQKEIVLPNKHVSPKESFWEGHLLDAETYVGGHVESIEAGVFRADIPVNFAVDPTACDELIRDLDAALEFSITVEEKKSMGDVTNYDEVKAQIVAQLQNLRDTPHRSERPLIYHLDVASMYPNIMTTNRLQPDSMIKEEDCATCDFNRPGKTCDRRMPWSWRGEYIPAKRDEYNMIRHALENERFPGKGAYATQKTRSFQELSADEQASLVRKRLQLYSQKVYHKIHDSKTITREAIICQRENPFYINTVRDFRDRRYDYKGRAKVWKGKTESLKSAGAAAAEIDSAKKMIVLFDSLQLAHKVILNSFYGYVMRKGSRWYSMEMAGVTCLTGAHIIQMARELVERLGRPLELDTDGIWCMLPATFPENFAFKLKNGKKMTISYPCVMLNHLVHARFTNHQYQTLVDSKTFRYETHSDNSIFFEVDGPYKAMVLPTSKEEDKNLKKRYAVFNDDGSLAELKGFEVKRRGELKLIKIFQQQIFKFFLDGSTLAECYASVAKIANRWLDVLHSKGATLADEELMELISENRSMSKTLEEYGSQKSTSITTARRLADFLGEGMVKDKGLNCKFIICARPRNAPVTERAVPVAIFSADEPTKRMYLKKWLKEEPQDTDPRALLDWDYYLERLGSVIQKLITIPAALQKIRNPVPRVAHPDWLQRRINIKDDKMKQKKLTDLFGKQTGPLEDITNLSSNSRLTGSAGGGAAADMEDFGSLSASQKLIKPTTTAGAVAEMLTIEEEETAAAKNPASSPTAAQKRKSPPETDDAASLDPFSTLPKVAPSASEDYIAFLEYQKKKWAIQKQARVRRRHLFGDRAGGGGGGGGGGVMQQKANSIQQSFQQRAEITFRNTWQLLQLKTTDSPGIVAAYVLIDARIHHLKIKVDRQVFLNLKSKDLPDIEIPGCEVEQVSHTLPNGHSSVYLFKLTVPEDVYFAEAEKFALLFNHPSVEGVYERQLPLNVRALLQLGNRCTIDQSQQGVLGRGLDQGFDLTGLIRPPKTLRPYLDPSAMAYIHLSHISSGERQIFGLFSTTNSQAHVVVLHKNRDSVQDMPNVGKLYGDMLARRRDAEAEAQAGATPAALAALSSEAEKEAARQAAAAAATWRECFPYQDALTVKVTQVTTRRKAFLEIGDVVKKMRKEEIGRPQILVVQSSQRNMLVHDIPVLGEFPVLPLKYDPLDSSLPPLGWQPVVARRLVNHYLALGAWVLHLVGLARYGDVPVCNLERDDPRFLIDVAYARRLQNNNVVLWWSGSPRPDHAGYEKDDVAGPLETVSLPKINNPGTFASVCIDIDVRNLAINTILTSSLINELEGADAAVSFNPAADAGGAFGDDADGGASTLYAENAFSNASILVLREMVKGWWAEACRGNAMADLVVNNLVRWVENPDSFLYDRALHYYVQMMSRKAFQQLMADFRRVGSQVIFASANRLLLQTTKAEVTNAYAYSQYIIKSIKSRPLFSFIEMDIKEYWDYLVWYDEYNYGGKACQTIGGGSLGELVTLPDGTQVEAEQPLETIMHWQMKTFLPVRLQSVFSDWVVEFVQLMHALKRPAANGQHGSQPRLTQLPPAVLHGGSGDVADGSVGKALLGASFERPLKKEIAALISTRNREMLHPELASDYDYPVLPGSLVMPAHRDTRSSSSSKKVVAAVASRDPILELVKSLMQVLSLDKNITMEARLLRKELLALFDVREFSRDAAFQNPSESLKLAQVSCDNCTTARDLDLCRDEDLLPDPQGGGAPQPWTCTFCQAEYDRIALEERLVAAVEAEALAWSVQDLKCGRCGALRVNDFMDHCTCSGEWGPTVRRDEVVRRLRVYSNVATFYGLRMLSDVVMEVMGGL